MLLLTARTHWSRGSLEPNVVRRGTTFRALRTLKFHPQGEADLRKESGSIDMTIEYVSDELGTRLRAFHLEGF